MGRSAGPLWIGLDSQSRLKIGRPLVSHVGWRSGPVPGRLLSARVRSSNEGSRAATGTATSMPGSTPERLSSPSDQPQRPLSTDVSRVATRRSPWLHQRCQLRCSSPGQKHGCSLHLDLRHVVVEITVAPARIPPPFDLKSRMLRPEGKQRVKSRPSRERPGSPPVAAWA